MTIQEAWETINAFFNDRSTYPDFAFYSRKRGINKDISEELYPLTLLADYLPNGVAIRLNSPSTQGPDGEIKLANGDVFTVQITKSDERDGGYTRRLTLRDKGRYIRVMDSHSETEKRLKRILAAIRDKEERYRTGTDVLLIIEERVKYSPLLESELKTKISEAVCHLPKSKYSQRFIVFGEQITPI